MSKSTHPPVTDPRFRAVVDQCLNTPEFCTEFDRLHETNISNYQDGDGIPPGFQKFVEVVHQTVWSMATSDAT